MTCLTACATAQPAVVDETLARSEVSRVVTERELSQTGSSTPRSWIDRWNQEPRDPDMAWPEATLEEEVEYYSFDARLVGEAAQFGGEGLHPAARGRLLTGASARDGLQANRVTGRAGLSVSLPLETATWFAILDLFRNRAKEPEEVVNQRGLGKYKQILQSQSKDRESASEAQTTAVTREISAFRVNSEIVCAAQVKIYGEQIVGGTAAQRARDQVDQTSADTIPEWQQRQRLGLEARGRGQVWSRNFSSMSEQGLEYGLEIQMSIEVDNDGGNSELRERAMQCRSPKPIFARELNGYRIEAVEEQGYWAVGVQATNQAGKIE